jgi:thymidylate kinase
MSKIIIFEGPDNVYKSTNVKNLFHYFTSEKLEPCNILHYNGIKILDQSGLELNREQYLNMFNLIKYHIDNNINLILDRSHIGEMVYSHYRNYDGSYIYELEEKFKYICSKAEIYIILLIDSPENLINREDGDSITIDYKHKKAEIEKFKEAVDRSIFKDITINVNNKSPLDIKNEILLNIDEISYIDKLNYNDLIKLTSDILNIYGFEFYKSLDEIIIDMKKQNIIVPKILNNILNRLEWENENA